MPPPPEVGRAIAHAILLGVLGLGLVVWAMKAFAVWSYGWMLGRDLDQGGFSDGKTAVREVAQFFTLVVSYPVALTAAIQEANPLKLKISISAYVIVSLATVGGIVIVLRSPGSSKHAFDWATIKIGRVLLLSSLTLVAVTAYFASERLLPGQTPFAHQVPLQLHEPKPYQKEGDKEPSGIVVHGALDEQLFKEGGIPSQLNLKLWVSKEFALRWHIEDVHSFSLDGSPTDRQPSRVVNPKKDSKQETTGIVNEWQFDELRADGRYKVVVYILANEGRPSADTLKSALANVAKEHPVKASIYYTDKK